MMIKENDIVVLKPLKQMPDYTNVNKFLYNKYKGKLLIAKGLHMSFDNKIRYFTYHELNNNLLCFTGPDTVAIRFEEGV